MKKLAKFFLFVFAAVLSMSLFVGCGGRGGDSDTYTIKVWAPAEDEFLVSMYEQEFKAIAAEKYPDYTIKIDYRTMAEPDAGSAVMMDAPTAADVFIFPDDQIIEMAKAGVLREVTDALGKQDIIANNKEASVSAATVDGKLLAYPMTADNTYFLIYDKRVLDEEDIGDMDTLLDALQAANKKLHFDLGNSWIIPSYFFGAGCTVSLNSSGSLNCDFNDSSKGISAAQGLNKALIHPAQKTGDDAAMKMSVETELGAVITGTWNLKSIRSAWGAANVGYAILPKYTDLNDNEFQLTAFGSHKLVGVNKFTQVGDLASDFANFISGEKGQQMRYEERGNVPTNIAVADTTAVKNDPLVNVITQQFLHSHPQYEVIGTFWSPVGSLSSAIVAECEKGSGKILTVPELQALLNTMVDGITATV